MCVCSAARSPARKVDSSVLSHQGRPMIRIIYLQLLVLICAVRSKSLACQAPLSMESSRQEYWSIFLLHFLLQGDLPNTERETMLPALQAVSLPLHHLESPWNSFISVQFSSVAQSCPTLCVPMNRSTPGLPVHHKLPELTQTHVHRVQPSHPLSSPSPPAPNPLQHQGLFQ